MNWKVVVVVLILGAVAFFGYRQWSASNRALTDLCERLRECTSPAEFARKFGDRESCPGSEAAERALEAFARCDPRDECHVWIDCGYGTGRDRPRPFDPPHETNFDQVLPHIE